jgi:hypothetical protein
MPHRGRSTGLGRGGWLYGAEQVGAQGVVGVLVDPEDFGAFFAPSDISVRWSFGAFRLARGCSLRWVPPSCILLPQEGVQGGRLYRV